MNGISGANNAAASYSSIENRMRFGWFRARTFPGVHIPREPYRSFETMKAYRDWCEQGYPAFYGYRKAKV